MATQSTSFSWQGRAWFERTKVAARHGVQLGLEHVLAEAVKIVPLDEGPLERSGKVTMDAGPSGTVSFDTPYAVIQHENLEYKHLPGRTAKYLEGPMLREADKVQEIIAATMRREGFLGGRL